MGGSDQWGNIVAGVDLIRRMKRDAAFGVTFPLITTSSGAKMGKTAKGAVWLDPERTSPYDYYQFWINTDDPDVTRFLSLFTFLSMDEIKTTEHLSGADLNSAKAVLAFEATLLAHGRESAIKALQAAESMFGSRSVSDTILPSSTIPRDTSKANEASVPQTDIPLDEFKEGIPAFKVFHRVGLARSGSDARRLIQQGGAYVNSRRIDSAERIITQEDISSTEIVLRAGKKRFHKVRIV